MKAMVIYESLTGTTKEAARLIAGHLQRLGHTVTAVSDVDAIDYQALSDAELVVLGTWTDGIFVVGQRPARAGRLKSLPAMRGKKVVCYCTYALNPGKVIEKMMAIAESLGADVVGGLAIKKNDLTDGTADFVDRLQSAVAA